MEKHFLIQTFLCRATVPILRPVRRSLSVLGISTPMVSFHIKLHAHCSIVPSSATHPTSPQSLASEGWQHEGCLVDLLAVVSAQLLFLLLGPRAHWLFDIAISVLAADHKANLSGWVGRDGGVCVLSDWEDFFAVLLELGNELEVEPLVLGWKEMLVKCIKQAATFFLIEVRPWSQPLANPMKIYLQRCGIGKGLQPCVVITPPSRRAPERSSKYDFSNRACAGPSGSLESVMMTSNSFLRSARNLKPSSTWTLTLGCSKPTAMPRRYFLERRMTACLLSIPIFC